MRVYKVAVDSRFEIVSSSVPVINSLLSRNVQLFNPAVN